MYSGFSNERSQEKGFKVTTKKHEPYLVYKITLFISSFISAKVVVGDPESEM